MNDPNAAWGVWGSDGLRMRYRPRTRLGQIWLTIVPWVDILLVGVLVFFLNQRLLLQPGIVFELPRAPFREGTHTGLTLVMLRIDRAEGAESLAFFDDERYQLGTPEYRDALRMAMSAEVKHRGKRDLLLHADRRVPHGDVMMLVNLAREAGVARVNVSLKPE